MRTLADIPVTGVRAERVRYRVVVRWEWWVEGTRTEVVGECRTAGELLMALAKWNKAPGVATLTYESRGSDGGWRREGRAA